MRNDQEQMITINPSVVSEPFEGWGTSLAWWGHAIGSWKEDEKRERIYDLIFCNEKGLGLNIVRYNIGGGENPAYNFMRPGGDVPGFQPKPGVWDWSADEFQIRTLLAALKRGADLCEAFSNSPPYWMTVSGSVTGELNGGNNLRDDQYDAFANYLTEVVKHFRDERGIVFHTLDPLNEPISDWWKKGNKQEGAYFDLDKQNKLLAAVGRSLKQKNLSETKLSAADENSIDETLEAFSYYDEETIAYISQINTHSYNGCKMAELRELARALDKRFWMSEYGTNGPNPHHHDDMGCVLELSDRIHLDMKIMQPTAWVYWQAVEDESAKNNWGFIHANFEGAEHYWITKQYFGMAQYTKFLRPGDRWIEALHDKCVAAVNEKENKLVVIVQNSDLSEKTAAFDLSGFEWGSGSTLSAYRTSASENLQPVNGLSMPENEIFRFVMPSESVTTFIFENIKPENCIGLKGV